MVVYYWIASPPERMGVKEFGESEVSVMEKVEEEEWDLNFLSQEQVDDINRFLNSGPSWNNLTGEMIYNPFITSHQLAGTVKLPFGGPSLFESYVYDFGVHMEYPMSPVLMDGIHPHALEFVWVRTTCIGGVVDEGRAEDVTSDEASAEEEVEDDEEGEEDEDRVEEEYDQ